MSDHTGVSEHCPWCGGYWQTFENGTFCQRCDRRKALTSLARDDREAVGARGPISDEEFNGWADAQGIPTSLRIPVRRALDREYGRSGAHIVKGVCTACDQNPMTDAYWLAVSDRRIEELEAEVASLRNARGAVSDELQSGSTATRWSGWPMPDAPLASKRDLIAALVDSQAELRSALGVYRLGCERRDFDPYIEHRMQASLAMQHELLEGLGHPMAQPAKMPEGWMPA